MNESIQDYGVRMAVIKLNQENKELKELVERMSNVIKSCEWVPSDCAVGGFMCPFCHGENDIHKDTCERQSILAEYQAWKDKPL